MSKKSVLLNREPVYRDLQTELRKRIHQGAWSKGAMIPSRRALADEFQVSVPTVQKAVADMVAEGILRVNAKRGTYVFGDPDPAPKDMPDLEVGGHRKQLDDVTMGRVHAHVGLLADIRPGTSSDFASGWPFIVVHEAEHALSQYGFQSRFFNQFAVHRKLGGSDINSSRAENKVSGEVLLEAVLAEKPAAVIVYERVVYGENHRLIHQAFEAGVRTVIVGSQDYGPECISVMYDSANAGYQAAKHLVEQGCQRILYFSAFQADWVATRLAGVRLAMESLDLPAEVLLEVVGTDEMSVVIDQSSDLHPHIPVAYNYAREVLSQGLAFDGVIAANDDAAFGFVRAAEELGLKMGADYSIIGFDDSPESQVMGLSTMHPPFASMGREAARVVARVLRGQDDLASVVLKSRLVVRASSSLKREK